MPRKPRKKSETGIYQVIVRRIGQQGIFQEEDDFQRYLDTTKKLSLESGVSVQAFHSTLFERLRHWHRRTVPLCPLTQKVRDNSV